MGPVFVYYMNGFVQLVDDLDNELGQKASDKFPLWKEVFLMSSFPDVFR